MCYLKRIDPLEHTMRKTLLLLLLLSTCSIYSQHQCGFDLMIDKTSGEWIDRGLSLSLSPQPESSAVTLPVVFHIVQDGNQGNLNDSDITTLLGHLNDAFANRGFYNPNTGVDTEISFCLAKQDEGGLPTSGITRTNSSLTNMTAENEDDDLKALVHWDATCYINIYIVFEINSAALGPGVQGYANFPFRSWVGHGWDRH